MDYKRIIKYSAQYRAMNDSWMVIKTVYTEEKEREVCLAVFPYEGIADRVANLLNQEKHNIISTIIKGLEDEF